MAKDVCDALGLTNTTVSLASLDDDERAKLNIGLHTVNTGTVFPAIRKDGAYVIGEEKGGHHC